MSTVRVAAAALAAVFASSAAPATSDAAVVCQKGKRIKLRVEACKANETQVANFGADPSGIWQHSSGPLLESTGSTPEFLVLNADGNGRLLLADPDTNVLSCGSFLYARGASPGLVLDLESIGYLGTRVLGASVAADVLTVTEVDGRATTFDRASAVDPAFDCGTLAQVSRFELMQTPEFSTGLAYDGVSLWFEEESTAMVHPVDPASGIPGSPLDIADSGFTHVHAMQGADFWTHADGPEAQRRTPAGATVDGVDTGADLGEPLSLRAIAFDAAAGELWLHGFSFELGRRRLLRVQTDVEPDVLVGAADFDVDLNALAFDGTDLWGLTSSFPQSIVRIDRASGQATATFTVSDTTVQWVGIASVGTQSFLVGRPNAGSGGVLLGLTPGS